MEDEDISKMNEESCTMSTEISIFSPVRDEAAVDYSCLFNTTNFFESRDELVDWVRRVGIQNRMVIIVRRSDSGESGRRARVFLGCERSGKYHGKVGRILQPEMPETETEGKKTKKRQTGTKKCGCPFLLFGGQDFVNGVERWSLHVSCGTHNHRLAKHFEGHSYAGRLTPVEEALVVDMTRCNTRPKDILYGVQSRHPDNVSTLRTIYNAQAKHRAVEHSGRSQLQFLMSKLEEHQYFFHVNRCNKTDQVKDLFFAHPTSVELLLAFPTVLLMDCTYKTNRYKMPLLEIVGVTSTNMTFLVGCAYMEREREENYMWAMSILKSLMNPSCLPTVIVTDKENALINAISATFPDARQLLCRWHIGKNVLANCKKMFRTKEEFDSFNSSWNKVMLAENEVDFKEHLRRFEFDYSDHPSAVQYCMNQWVNPYKERFISSWTNNIMHFNNTTTNRAESAHAKLKRHLGSSVGNFETCWTKMHSLLQTTFTAIKSSFEKSVNVVQHRYQPSIFKMIRGEVSIAALDLILNELKVVNDIGIDSLLCGCLLRKTCGLPCAHELSELKRLGEPISLDSVDKFWRKLDFEKAKGDDAGVGHDIHVRVHDSIADYLTKFNLVNPSQQLLMLKRLREILKPETTSLIPPEIPVKPRGRPPRKRTKNVNSTKRDPSKFEIVESFHDSCSPIDQSISLSGPSGMKPMFTSIPRTKQPIVRKKTRSSMAELFVSDIPSLFQSYVIETKNVLGDGHCGYRAVAYLMGYGEDAWSKVRRDLVDELQQHRDMYANIFIEIGSVDRVFNALNYYDSPAPSKYWLQLPEMGHLIASAYNVILVTLARTGCWTFLPFRTSLPVSEDPKCICIALVNGDTHFIAVSLRTGHPLPRVPIKWYERREECALGWDVYCAQQLKLYNEIMGDTSGTHATIVDK